MRIYGDVAVAKCVHFGAPKPHAMPVLDQSKLTAPDEAQEGDSMAVESGRRLIDRHHRVAVPAP